MHIAIAELRRIVKNKVRTCHRVMAGRVAAIPMLRSAALHLIEITGTRPVMTREGALPQPSP
jgi:hypothetical protein